MSQMTHFPALAPEEDLSVDTTSLNNSGSGILTSFFGNIFRSAPNSSADSTAHNKPVQVVTTLNRDSNTNSISSQLQELPANGFPANAFSQPSSNNSLPVDDRSQSSSSAQSQAGQNLQKKLSIRISSVFKADENNSNENGGPRGFASNGLIDYQRSEFRRYWMPDSTGKECYECHEKFSAFRRRHHCRLCGQIFCGRCSNRQINGAELGYAGVLRLCTFCANQVDDHVKSRRKEESLIELQRNSVAVICSASPYQSVTRKTSTGSRKKSTVYRVGGGGTGEVTALMSRADEEMTEHPSLEENVVERFAEERSSPDDADHPFSSAYRYSPIVDEDDAFLERMFQANIERLLDSLLEREFLEPTLWRPLLLGLSRRVVNMVMPTILKVPDALNILDFVHIKKLPTEQEPSFEIVEGVAFSKALTHSAMCVDAKNVSVMLLAGNITYERVVEKLSSLETILLQEQEYLKIQVDRIISRRVTLLLVEHSVARLAADMLLTEGVALATGVKRRVLERVARSTNADIVTSLDAQFLQPRVGFVPDFAQREFTLVDGSAKKILTLDNCFGEFGVSVLLHGSSLKELVAAKRVLKFLLVTCFSTRLECAFLALFNSRPGSDSSLRANGSENITENVDNADLNADSDDDHPLKHDEAIDGGLEARNDKDSLMRSRRPFDCALCEFNRQCEAESDTDLSEFIRHFRRLQLTNSPAIRFAPPYLETEAGRGCALTPYFRSPLFRFVGADDLETLRADEQRLRDELMSIIERNSGRKAENQRLRHAMLEGDVLAPSVLLDAGRWAQFRSHSALLFRRRHELNAYSEWKKFAELKAVLKRRQEAELRGNGDDTTSARTAHLYANASMDALSAYNRQRIAFLYCANARKSSTTARTFCIGPYVLLRQFFFGQESGHKDTGLGSFLVNYCFNADYKCSGCERSMMDHLRRIVHRNARVEITTHVVPQRTSAISSSSASIANGATGGIVASGSGGSGGGIAPPPPPPDGELNLDELPSSIPNMNCSSIICWRRCPRCAANSCIVPLPDTVFHLSFAKFIDYLVNGTYWTSNFPSAFCGSHHGALSGGTIDDTCRHCTFHEHVHFFAHYNHVACFSVVPIRPLHVVFNPMVCRIQPERVLCSELIEANYDLNSMASDVFERALSSFRDHHCVIDSPLLSFVEQFKTMFRSQMGKFDPEGMFKRSKLVESNNAYYLQSAACLMRCRYLLHSFIIKWNTTRSDPSYLILVDTSAVATSSTAVVPLIGAFAAVGAAAETNAVAGLRRGNASTNDCASNKLSPSDEEDGHGEDAEATAAKTENTRSGGSENGDVDEDPIFGSFVSSGGATTATNGTVTAAAVPMKKSASTRFSENDDAGGSLPLEPVGMKAIASGTAAPTATVVTRLMEQLPSIDSPLPRQLHFELSMNSSMILVRDWPTDAPKGGGGGAAGNGIDIGSLIAYALASTDYEERRKGREGAATNTDVDGGSTNFYELSFSGGGHAADSRSIQFSVKMYFPNAFEQMRSTLFGDGEEQFRRSLARTVPWHPQGGKSGANFFRTEDERFIIKQLSRFELESFKKCGPKYLDYVGAALRERKLTALCKIFGVYGVQFTGRGQPNVKMDVLVMEYLFYRRGVRQIWDLKGSLRNRYASTKHDAASVLLDENLVQDLWGNQLYVHPYSKAALNQAIINDSHFLSNQGIMDYSLLAGICQDNDEVVIGIVDYMRTYTLDKKVESLVKTALPIAHSPTVVSPELYRKRFYEAIDGYFAIAPDQWTHTTEVPLKQ